MPGAVRKPDLDSSGNPNESASEDTFIDNLQLVRYSDVRTPPCTNVGITVPGAFVYCNNLHVQWIGHPTDCPSTQTEGSPDVIVN